MFLSAIFLALSANIDTLFVFISYGINKTKISLINKLIIVFINSLGTYLSIKCGALLSNLFPDSISDILGGTILSLLGLIMLINCYLPEPEDSDIAISEINTKKSILLALTLTINNIGIGIAAGLSDVSAIWTTICTFLFTVIIIPFGIFIGKTISNKINSEYSEILSGLLLIIIGIYEIFG